MTVVTFGRFILFGFVGWARRKKAFAVFWVLSNDCFAIKHLATGNVERMVLSVEGSDGSPSRIGMMVVAV